ncbi:MAG: cell wall hydrolase, partial [Lachnospiraceae bacterium]|nr:cell wall hydrolase [Lachnospiraceae bacterium]
YFQSWGGAYRSTFFEYDGEIYYADETSVMQTGWEKLDGNWYYFRSWGGMYRSTFFEYDGETYYANDDGIMQTGWLELNGAKYYFRSWGGMYRDQFFDCDEATYYADSDGAIAIGWNVIQGEEYYFDQAGVLAKNQWFDSERKPTDKEPSEGFYYTDGNGILQKDYYVKLSNETEMYYSFGEDGACIYVSESYVKAKDSVNGSYYILEHQYYTDPKTDERDFLAAICYAEANNQKKTGMTAVAMVIRNRMNADQCSSRTVIYKKQQFEPARSGVLTKLLEEINQGEISKFTSCGAYDAVDESEEIMSMYLSEGKNRVIDDFGDSREDFDYLYFMTPEAFEKQGLDPDACITYTYTYRWNVNGEEKSSSHIFFVKWVKKA